MRWLREQPDQQALVRDCFFDDPLLDAAERFYESGEWRGVAKLLPSHKGRVLDIGAGRGISSYALARDGWDTVALEPDASDLVGNGAIRALASEAGLSIEVVQEWGEKLPFAEASFDLVHCRQVLHHAHDLNQLLREVGRVLKPGGTLIATREHVISKPDDLPAFLAVHPLEHLYGGEHAYLLDEYLGAIRGAGLHMTHCLNSLASEINLYPKTIDDIKRAVLKRIFGALGGAAPAWAIPDWVIVQIGNWINEPGRLYTFVARKAEGAQ